MPFINIYRWKEIIALFSNIFKLYNTNKPYAYRTHSRWRSIFTMYESIIINSAVLRANKTKLNICYYIARSIHKIFTTKWYFVDWSTELKYYTFTFPHAFAPKNSFHSIFSCHILKNISITNWLCNKKIKRKREYNTALQWYQRLLLKRLHRIESQCQSFSSWQWEVPFFS